MAERNMASTKRCILYYPTITVPSGEWLRSSLLYWDEVGSIVPQGYDHAELIPYTPDIQFLKEEGEFRPFRPDDFILRQGYDEIGKFEDEFTTIFCSKHFQRMLLPKQRRILNSKIHYDKISDRIFHFLQEQGVATQKKGDYEWCIFEPRTALLYMALLAKYVADFDMDSTIPGTDNPAYENLIFQAASESDSLACLSIGLRNLLPVPRADTRMSDILKFKRKRRTELLSFRQIMDEYQDNLKGCLDGTEAKDVTVRFSERIELGLEELDAVLEDEKLATVVGSLKSLIKLESPALWATVGLVTDIAPQVADLPLEWSLAGIGILGAIEVGAYLVDRRNEKRAMLRDSPLAYLYYAEKRWPFRRGLV